MNLLILIGGILGLAAVAVVVFFVFFKKKGSGRPPGKLASNLKSEQMKSEIILGSIEDGVMLIDSQGVIQLFNQGACKITGWTAEDAIGIDYHGIIKLVDDKNTPYDNQRDPFAITMQTKHTARDNRAVLALKSGNFLPIDISTSPLANQSESVTGIVGIFRDVSKERTQEQQSAEFISTASHEMRTPVAAIEGYIALALNEHVARVDTKAREYLEKAHSSTQQLGKLFQDLLTSAKAEDGRLVSHPQAVDMGEFIEQLSDSLRFAAEKKGLLVDYTLGTTNEDEESHGSTKIVRPLYYVHVDPDRLREVITNLFDNAVKYTESGKISFGLTGNKDIVQFFIKDTGNGIAPEDLPHLFQKFYRVDSSATRTIGGTGLGLFICRKVVEMYNGRIWVESKLREGSTFYINLPRLSTAQAIEILKTQPQPIQNL